jgi:nitrogen regulatory protein P-II 1
MSAQLLLCVVNEPSKVEEILEAFLDIGVTGATIIDTYGMGGILASDIPIFAGFRQLLSGSGSNNKTILSVIDRDETLQATIQAIEQICGNLDDPSTGIVFTIPVSFVKGLRPEIS